MISMMLEASSRVLYLTTFTSGLIAVIDCSAESTFGDADAVGRVDDLALQVREVDLVVVDDAERADAGGREVERGRRAEPAGAEQQHLRLQQLGLALEPDLRDQQVARVALALLGGQRLRDLDLVAAVLPQRDPAGHRLHVLVAEQVLERVRGERGALAGGAVEDDLLRAVGADDALDARLQIPARDVLGAGDVPGVPLLALAHVDQDDPVAQVLAHLGRVDLLDLALDLADDLRPARAHAKVLESRSGFKTSQRIAPPWGRPHHQARTLVLPMNRVRCALARCSPRSSPSTRCSSPSRRSWRRSSRATGSRTRRAPRACC